MTPRPPRRRDLTNSQQLLDRLLREPAAPISNITPSCHPEAQLTAHYQRGTRRRPPRVHLYCGACRRVVLTVETR